MIRQYVSAALKKKKKNPTQKYIDGNCQEQGLFLILIPDVHIENVSDDVLLCDVGSQINVLQYRQFQFTFTSDSQDL